MQRNRPRIGPAWMVEGSAETVQYAWRTGPGGQKSQSLSELQKYAREGTKVLRSMHDWKSLKDWKEYAIAHFAVHLLARRKGEQAVFNYWRYIGQGRNWESAFKAAFGLSMAQYEQQFQTYRSDATRAAQFARGG